MEKLQTPELRTGEFAKLCGTTKRTLFHYDKIGLFSPAFVDETGYRYYSESQCDTFFTITCLQELGMPLKEIRQYVERRSPEALLSLLEQQERQVVEELAHLRRIEQVIHTKLQLIRAGTCIRFSGRLSPMVVEYHAQAEMVLSDPIVSTDRAALLQTLLRHIGHCMRDKLNTGHPYGAILDVARLRQGERDPYTYFVTQTKAEAGEDVPIHTKPAGLYACVYLRGDYYDAEEGFAKLLDGMEQERLVPGACCYKEAVWDELAVDGMEELLTRIAIGIADYRLEA